MEKSVMNSRFDFTIGSQTPHNVSCSSSLYSGDIGASTFCGSRRTEILARVFRCGDLLLSPATGKALHFCTLCKLIELPCQFGPGCISDGWSESWSKEAFGSSVDLRCCRKLCRYSTVRWGVRDNNGFSHSRTWLISKSIRQTWQIVSRPKLWSFIDRHMDAGVDVGMSVVIWCPNTARNLQSLLDIPTGRSLNYKSTTANANLQVVRHLAYYVVVLSIRFIYVETFANFQGKAGILE
ncbi:Uncharacterized protein LW93_13867 [Fusarium fujikuroi]|nr:Uncharacterized protein LW93_13867 [Fusarium fujikuroi]